VTCTIPAARVETIKRITVQNFEKEAGELVQQLGEVLRKMNRGESLAENDVPNIQRINRESLFPLLHRLKTLGYCHFEILKLNDNDELEFTSNPQAGTTTSN